MKCMVESESEKPDGNPGPKAEYDHRQGSVAAQVRQLPREGEPALRRSAGRVRPRKDRPARRASEALRSPGHLRRGTQPSRALLRQRLQPDTVTFRIAGRHPGKARSEYSWETSTSRKRTGSLIRCWQCPLILRLAAHHYEFSGSQGSRQARQMQRPPA